MRLAVVGPAPPLRGGIAQHSASLARAALARGHEVDVISFRRLYPGPFFPGRSQLEPAALSGGGSPVPALASRAMIDSLDPRSWLRVGREIAARGADAVLLERWHPFFAPALATIATAPRRAGARIVWMVHNARPHENPTLSWAPLLRLGMHGDDAYLTHAASQAQALRDLGIAASVQVLPLPSQDALPPLADPVEARRALGLPKDEVVFLFFGHVRAYKGVDVLLEALARLPEQGPPWRALIVGEWYIDRSSAAEAVARPPLRGRVTIEDRFVAEPEIARYFAAASAVVLPYRAGTQSGVVSMSYALERPVIATDVEGLAEAVRDGATGSIVPREDPSALARALEEVRRGREFSREAIADAHRHASWGSLVAAIEAVSPRAAC